MCQLSKVGDSYEITAHGSNPRLEDLLGTQQLQQLTNYYNFGRDAAPPVQRLREVLPLLKARALGMPEGDISTLED